MSSGEVQLQARDEKILDHIGRYRITLRPVLDAAFFEAESSGSGNVLQRLLDANLVTARDGLPGRRKYYQLTARGAAGRVTAERTKPMRAQALRSALAVLWLCHMTRRSMHRMEKWELREILEQDPPPGTHCTLRGQPARLYRVQVPGARTRPAAIINALKDNLDDAKRHPIIRFWLEDQRYGFAILCETERAAELRSAVTRHKLSRYASILIEPVPSPQTLARAIHEHRASQAAE